MQYQLNGINLFHYFPLCVISETNIFIFIINSCFFFLKNGKMSCANYENSHANLC